jgi:hypothetical protein
MEKQCRFRKVSFGKLCFSMTTLNDDAITTVLLLTDKHAKMQCYKNQFNHKFTLYLLRHTLQV